MAKEFSKFEVAAIKRTAANVSKFVTEKEKLEQKKAALDERLQKLQEMIDGWQAPIKAMTGGFTTESLVKRIVDKSGKNPITKFELLYPETVVPVNTENTQTDMLNISQEIEPTPSFVR